MIALSILRKSLLLTAVLWSAALFSQSNIIDSLKMELHQATNDTAHWVDLYNISQAFASFDLDSALYYAEESLRWTELKNMEAYKFRSYNNIGLHQLGKGEFEKALENFLRALDLSKQIGNRQGEATTLMNVGLVYQYRGEFAQSMNYYDQALELQEAEKDSLGIVRLMVNSGLVQLNLGNLEDALQRFQNGLAVIDELGSDLGRGILISNSGMIYYQQENYREAQKYFLRSYEMLQAQNEQFNIIPTVINLGSTYVELDDFEKGVQYYQEALDLSKSTGTSQYLPVIYQALYEAYERQKDYENSLAYHKLYFAYSDSLNQELNSKNVAEMQTRFETKEKEAQLTEQKLIIARQKNAQKNLGIAAILALLLLTAIFQYLRNRQKLQQREAQLALALEKTAADKLRELDQLKSSFFANISHEFRTPLTLIKSPLQGLITGDLKGEAPKYFRIMNRNADRLLELVNQLLDLSKLESGKMSLNLAEGDLHQFLRAIAYSFESMTAQKQIDYQIAIPQDPLLLPFDADKLEKIVTNLLSNAFKFTPEEGRVKITVEQENEDLLIAVEDNGMGIPSDQLPHIFKRFYQSDHTSDLQASSGIGLALTNELVQLHGGKMEVESEENRRTVFKVRLPLRSTKSQTFSEETTAIVIPEKEGHMPEVARASSPPAFSTEAFFNPKRLQILVVEDNADVRTYIEDQLQNKYMVMTAENGKEGLAVALEKIPDLIITDLMMPEMDGTALCRSLKTDERTSHIPVIMLTAKADRSDKIKGLETGADDYLTKPFDAEELLVRVGNLILQRQLLREKFAQQTLLGRKVESLSSVEEQFMKKVIAHIEQNLEEETFSVVDLANALAMSRSQLHRKLKALTDCSPSVLIRSLRLERAKQLLEQKAGNASEIGFMVGFSSATYFAKCFADHYGFSPSHLLKH